MAKMTNDQLKQLQALPLNIKIRKTEQRIREWYEHLDNKSKDKAHREKHLDNVLDRSEKEVKED